MSLEEAGSFSTAMGQLAQQRGYIVREGGMSGYTYRCIQSEGVVVGKMNLTELIATANQVASFAEFEIGGVQRLSGEQLKNLEDGIAELRRRVNRHVSTLWQRFFVDFGEVTAILKTTNFRQHIANRVSHLPAQQLNDEERREVVRRYLESDGTEINAHRDEVLDEKFYRENLADIQLLQPYGEGIVREVVSNNVNLMAIKSENDQILLDLFIQHIQGCLREKCQQKMFVAVENDPEFRTFIAKYRTTCPAQCEGKSDIQLVREAGLPDFNKMTTWTKDVQIERVNQIAERSEAEQEIMDDWRSVFNSDLADIITENVFGKKEAGHFSKTIRKRSWALVGNMKRVPRASLLTKELVEQEELNGGCSIKEMSYIYYLLKSSTNKANFMKLDEDLKRSIPFVLEAMLYQLNPEKGESPSTRIMQELSKLEVGQRIFLPTGSSRHGTMLMLTKGENNKIELHHFNTGFGMKGQRALLEEGSSSQRKYPIAVRLEIDLNRAGAQENLQDFLFYALFVRDENMDRLYQGIKEINAIAGTGAIQGAVMRKKSQRTGNCYLRCILEAVRMTVGKESYRDLKLLLINDCLMKLKEIPHPTSTDKALYLGLCELWKKTTKKRGRVSLIARVRYNQLIKEANQFFP